MADELLDSVIAEVLASRKYRTISPALVRRIAERELLHQQTTRDVVKSTKNKLHQIAGAYHGPHFDYTKHLAELQQTVHDDGAFQATCARIIARHASTRERLPLLDRFYGTLFADLPPITSILDLACGLNPLTLPWMQRTGAVDHAVHYFAYDIDVDLADFLTSYLQVRGASGRGYVHDLVVDAPSQAADVALIFKTLPVLEQIEAGAGARLIETVNAPVLLVSYPARSLGGRHKGMVAHYEEQFSALMANRSWSVEKFLFESELVFRVIK